MPTPIHHLLYCSGRPVTRDPLDDDCAEYRPGRTYFTDDQCEFAGQRYICVAPEGQPCRHSPAERPRDWEEVEP